MKFTIENIPNQKAIELAQGFEAYIDSIQARHHFLCKELSNYDLQISDIYHAIENLNLPASTMSQLCKELKGILKARREIKEEYDVLQKIETRIGKSKIDVNMNKTYVTRTHVLDKYIKE